MGLGRQAACRDRSRVCPFPGRQGRHNKYQTTEQARNIVMRSVDRIGMGVGMGIGQTRGLSLHLRAFRPNWYL